MTEPIDVSGAAGLLRSRLPSRPSVAVVLGSGLGQLVDTLDDATSVSFEELPGFPPSGVPGHEGRFVCGRLAGADVLFQCGRYHLYEGHDPGVVAAPSRIAAELGIQILVLTNASGGLQATLEPGELVLLEDHVNAMGRNPLVGTVRQGEARFPDMSHPYDPVLREMALTAADELGIALRSGVYVGVLGPSYETAAEVRLLGQLGADVVGMSTVPEVIVARARGMRCLAFSVVTNKATGLSSGPLSHQEVVDVGRQAGVGLARLLTLLVPRLADAAQSTSTK